MKLTVTPMYELNNVQTGRLEGTIMQVDALVNESMLEHHVFYGYQLGTRVIYDETWGAGKAVEMMLQDIAWSSPRPNPEAKHSAQTSFEYIPKEPRTSVASGPGDLYIKNIPLMDNDTWNLYDYDRTDEEDGVAPV